MSTLKGLHATPPPNLRTELGKIGSLRIGLEEGRFGVFFTFTFQGSGVSDSWHTWADGPTEGAKWTEPQREAFLAHIAKDLINILQQSKVNDTRNLVGKPVEVTFDGNKLTSWRILTEVL